MACEMALLAVVAMESSTAEHAVENKGENMVDARGSDL